MGGIAASLGVHEAGGSLCHCRTQSLSSLLVISNIKSDSISLAIPIAFVSVCFPEIASLSKYEQNVCLLQREASAAGSASSIPVQPCLKSSLEKNNLFFVHMILLILLQWISMGASHMVYPKHKQLCLLGQANKYFSSIW